MKNLLQKLTDLSKKLKAFWNTWKRHSWHVYGEHYAVSAEYDLTQPVRLGLEVHAVAVTDWYLDISVRVLPFGLHVTLG